MRATGPLTIAIAMFVITRVVIGFVAEPWSSDVVLYEKYAALFERAAATQTDVYALHREARNLPVEYPPLAFAFTRAPAAIAKITGWRYVDTFRRLMLLFDTIAFALVVAFVRRWFAGESPWSQALRLIVYIATTAISFHVLYDRLDVVAAVSLIAACALLDRDRPYWAIPLAAGAAFKLMPALALPVLLIHRKDRWASVVTFGACFMVFVVAGWIAYGPAGFEFLAYHRDRPLQVESTYASLLLVGGWFGGNVNVVASHGSFGLVTPIATIVAKTSSAAVVLVLGLCAWRARSAVRSTEHAPGQVAALLVACVAVSKVFSPQYILLILPLIPLAALGTGRRAAVFALTLGVCALTTAVFPYLYMTDIVGLVRAADGAKFTGPTSLGASILFARNLAFVALAIVMVRWTTERTP